LFTDPETSQLPNKSHFLTSNGSRLGKALFARKAFTIICLVYSWSSWMSVRSAVVSQFEQVAIEQKKTLARLYDDRRLLDVGLDSLGLALIVVRLEEVLGFDPFDSSEDVQFPVTFGEFVRLYEDRKK
jgi:acyl carrier protein